MLNTIDLKSDVFTMELSYIKNERLKSNARLLLDLLPDYFYKIPATSSGKYHPSFAQGAGGLVRHTKAALRIAREILDLEFVDEDFTNDEKDLILISILLHDGLKSGLEQERYTRFDHPLLIAKFIQENEKKTNFVDDEIKFIIDGLKSHMGQWNKSSYSNVVLPKPKTKAQKFIHMCDYLSSKKFLDVNFDSNNCIDENIFN